MLFYNFFCYSDQKRMHESMAGKIGLKPELMSVI